MDIYYGDINDYTIEYLDSIVSEASKIKAHKKHFEADTKRSLLASALLTYAVLDKKWDVSIPVIPKVDKYGKPHIYDNESKEKHFSISHSGDIVVCAISDNCVGVDIEAIGDYRQGIVDRFFSLHERMLVHDKDSFFNIWSLKESYMKVTGLGMALAMDCFYVKPDSADETKYTYEVESLSVTDDIVSDRLKINDRITGHIIKLRDGYSSAVCGVDWDGIYEIRKVEKI